jgi:hypothetical protein
MMMRKLIGLFVLLLLSVAVQAADKNKTVTKMMWDNPTSNIAVTSIEVDCGSQTASVTDPAQFQPGAPGSVLLTDVIKVNGTFTCAVRAAGAEGLSDPSNSTPPITRTSSGFTIVVTVPDPRTNLRAQ